MILNGKNIVAVASDFDGTILKKGMITPPAFFFEVVEKMLAKNIPFIAASGRQYANLQHILSPIADRISYIAENGCLVVHQGQIIHKSILDRELALQVAADMRLQPGTEIMISGENTSYISPSSQDFADLLVNYFHNNTKIVKDFHEIPEDIIKMTIYWEKGIPSEPEKWFHEKYDNRLLITNAGNGWLDFNSKESGKGEALHILSQHMNIPIEQIAVFGDSENDISMLREAGVSYAVSSASANIQAVADCVCDSVEQVLFDALA